MTRRFMMVVGALFLLLSFTPLRFTPVQAQGADNPYIYYYSGDLNAFVIEHADGTDTRVLGKGLMPIPDAYSSYYMGGPGWSPSGKWFAWTAAQESSGGSSGDKPYVISADGS